MRLRRLAQGTRRAPFILIVLALIATCALPAAASARSGHHKRHHRHHRHHKHRRSSSADARAFQFSGVEGGLFSPALHGKRSLTVHTRNGIKKSSSISAASTVSAASVNTSVMPALDFSSPADVTSMRQALIGYIWKGASSLPTGIPDTIQTGVSDPPYSSMTNLKRIDKYTDNMEYGVSVYSYLFTPTTSNGKLMVVWNGHDGSASVMQPTIQYFLNQGYTIIEGWMPLQPEYPASTRYPVVSTHDLGTFTLWSHYYLSWIDSPSFSPIKFFIDPVIKDLNYALAQKSYSQVSMVGLSGGGWTTHLAAALDPRIQKSYPVAGSQPFYLRNDYNPGDWEQYVGGLYNISEYMEWYVLGSYGSGRRQLQIFNSADPCCFSGATYNTNPYESVVQQKLASLGSGQFNVYIDTNNQHSITSNALSVISNDLAQP